MAVLPTEWSLLFFRLVLKYLWHHPYDHDQWVFERFLRAIQSASVFNVTMFDRRWPHWDELKDLSSKIHSGNANIPSDPFAVLDPYTEFATARIYESEGWSGEYSDIVAWHFLDGQGGVKDDIAWNRQYFNLWEVFYGNETFLSARDVFTNHQIRRALVSSRRNSTDKDFFVVNGIPECLTWDPIREP